VGNYEKPVAVGVGRRQLILHAACFGTASGVKVCLGSDCHFPLISLCAENINCGIGISTARNPQLRGHDQNSGIVSGFPIEVDLADFSVRIPFVPGDFDPTSGAEFIENDVLTCGRVALVVIQGGDDQLSKLLIQLPQ
jgi:hypothetical protein